MPYSRAKELVGAWGKGTHDTVADSIRYHFGKHGDGRSLPKYLNDALNFRKKRGVKGKWREDGKKKWGNGDEFLIDDGKDILTFGPSGRPDSFM